MEKIKVKIKKHTNPSAWYRNEIGKEFEVISDSDTHYDRADGVFGYILKSGCEIIPTRIEKPSLEFLLSLKHGQRVRVKSLHDKTFEAVINMNEKFNGYAESFYLCQNSHDGKECKDKMGMQYSWGIHDTYQIKWIELINEPESVKPIVIEVNPKSNHLLDSLRYALYSFKPVDLSSVTMLFEETITFTEDEQFDIQLIDEMLEHLMK